jgi:hypothetical protein
MALKLVGCRNRHTRIIWSSRPVTDKVQPAIPHETYGGNLGYRIYEVRECNELINFLEGSLPN